MSIVNVDNIINGTPTKRINNGYQKMKQNYTEASAQEYYDVYKNEPLSSFLESSRLIFSEPYYGYKCYKESIEDVSNCIFNSLESESEKVSEYLEENGSNISDEQREMYVTLEKLTKR